jgi:Fur family transcriptional regulator, stress-responsive regulator
MHDGPVLVSDATRRLREAGLRVTRSRLTLLALLDEPGTHHTADEIVGLLAKSDHPIPRATVYSVLDTLGRAGVVLVADAGPGAARYESARDWHHHLACRQCGQVVDVPCVVGAKPCLEAALPGAIIESAQVTFRGLCPACAAQRN